MSKVLVGQLEEKELGAPGSWVAGKGSARWLSVYVASWMSGYVVGGWVVGGGLEGVSGSCHALETGEGAVRA